MVLYDSVHNITKVYNNIPGNVLFPYSLDLFKNENKYTLINNPIGMSENETDFSYFDYQINPDNH